MNKRIYVLAFMAMTFFVFNAVDSEAMNLEKRLAIIKGLKIKGVVGENNKGYLEFRGKKKAEKVVNDENESRKKVYQDIAKKQGVSAEQVGKQRALQNTDNSPKGTWVQKEDGSWTRKK